MGVERIRVASSDAQRRMAGAAPLGLAVVIAVMVVLFVWGWTRGSDARVLAALPRDERARLFQLTRSKAEAFCAEPRLEERCREEVKLLGEFPECAGECRAFVAQHRPRGSR
jgi:hypothetical protein